MRGGWIFDPFNQPPATYTGEAGIRFWYGKSTTAKNLYDNSGSLLVSRLTYGSLSIFAAEAYTRFDLNRRWFLKGYVGGGTLRRGNLKDEDFPTPAFPLPYSATFSTQQDSSPIYANVDAGANILFGPDFRVGLFAGFHYMNETVSAFGCTQVAFNPLICGPPIPDPVKVITQDNNWYAMRLGIDGAFQIGPLRFSAEAAWLPSVWLYGSDAHWLRMTGLPGDFNNPIPEDGKGWGYQLEGFVSYCITPAVSLGIGGRYWHMETGGLSHFENHVVALPAFPQPVNWKVDDFGMFLQLSVSFGPYPVIDVH